MSEYSKSKSKPLFFKGVCKSVKQSRDEAKNKIRIEKTVWLIPPELIEESKKHGGWWIIDRRDNLASGKIGIQHSSGAYWSCLESGDITLGEIRDNGESAPIREETFTLARVTEDKFGIKTCYDKYIGAYSDGTVYSRTEAISPQESLELVIQDGKVAILGGFNKFFSYNNGVLSAISPTASSDNEIFVMRTNRPTKKKRQLQETEVEDLGALETNLVKKFQNFSNQHYVISKESPSNLFDARSKGKLSEELLNRRTRIKSDKYCK